MDVERAGERGGVIRAAAAHLHQQPTSTGYSYRPQATAYSLQQCALCCEAPHEEPKLRYLRQSIARGVARDRGPLTSWGGFRCLGRLDSTK